MTAPTAAFDHSAFEQLPAFERALLQLLSVIYAPVAASPLLICTRRVDLKDEDSSGNVSLSALKELLQSLDKRGWVENQSNRYRCRKVWCERILLTAVEDESFETFSNEILQAFEPRQVDGETVWQDMDHGLSQARIHLYRADKTMLKQTLRGLKKQFRDSETPLEVGQFYADVFGNPPDPEILSALAPDILNQAFSELAHSGMHQLQDIHSLWNLLQEKPQEGDDAALTDVQALYCLLTGQLADLQGDGDGLANPIAQLVTQGHDGITDWYDGKNKVQELLSDGAELSTLLLMGLLTCDSTAHSNAANAILLRHNISPDHRLLKAYADAQNSNMASVQIGLLSDNSSQISLLLCAMIMYWLDQAPPDGFTELLSLRQMQADQSGYLWLSAEYSRAMSLLDPASRSKYSEQADALFNKLGAKSLFALVTPKPQWARALDALSQVVDTSPESTTKDSTERLVWMLDLNRVGVYSLQARLQKLGASGNWSKGRSLSLRRLKHEFTELSDLHEKDVALCNLIHAPLDSRYSSAEYEIDMNAAWPVLASHPNLYWERARNTPLEIVEGEFELLVQEEGEQLRISFYPSIPANRAHEHFVVQEETPTRLCVYRKNDQVMRLYDILNQGLTIPREAEGQLRETLSSLAPMICIQSDLEGIVDAEPVEADARIHANLLPYGDGLRVTLRVQPFGDFGPLYPPGTGRTLLLTERNGERFKTKRDFDLENRNLDDILESGLLGELVFDEDDEDEHRDEFLLDSPQLSLELLEQLYALGDTVVVAWPEGESLRINDRIDSNSMRLSINRSEDWFELDGEVQVNGDLVLTLRQILELSRAGNGRFIQLGDGEYVALTRQLQQKLNAIDAIAESDAEGTRVSKLAALSLSELTEGIGACDSDVGWQQHLEHLKSLEDFKADIPKTLKTELRDYQEQGFQWLCRLAEWGVGACLADDMGLGKTVQTLALLLRRESLGPALVIAPTSVCNNWYSEAAQFAPSLDTVGYRGKERGQVLEQAGPGTLVICSYGLLQQDAEQLLEMQWSTIVLDEAQAIKNVGAKRTRAAHKLKGDFKVVTTGTPIENHLGELWSLFRFLNPGLLHSQDRFVKRFMQPIERDQDDNIRNVLKSMVKPFMLRRTKSQVLDELPPRTEITLDIPLSEGERSLYEAVRQQALDGLDAVPGNEQANRMKVLAAITRLRLASCHPSLVMPDSTLESSKLRQFATLLEELLDNDHKALVFSQFVKHLTLIRKHLDKEGISYQYLDGSTTMAQRKQRVDAFQNGEGDVFLISLKAGGSGLNLTAADYVVHMDPWWNPAVEDQASDRAHRIGQDRPVTVYRLVAENTIEQKIIKLHKQKRDLAESLLEGSDASGRMTADQMLSLLKEL